MSGKTKHSELSEMGNYLGALLMRAVPNAKHYRLDFNIYLIENNLTEAQFDEMMRKKYKK